MIDCSLKEVFDDDSWFIYSKERGEYISYGKSLKELETPAKEHVGCLVEYFGYSKESAEKDLVLIPCQVHDALRWDEYPSEVFS